MEYVLLILIIFQGRSSLESAYFDSPMACVVAAQAFKEAWGGSTYWSCTPKHGEGKVWSSKE